MNGLLANCSSISSSGGRQTFGRLGFRVPRRRQKLQRGKRQPFLRQTSFKELRFKLVQFGLEETLIPINISLVRA
jgi:hypothetical protein